MKNGKKQQIQSDSLRQKIPVRLTVFRFSIST